MKKIILALVFSLVCSPCFAQVAEDYWVYVRLEDESGVTAQEDIGRSKRGDVIAVVKADGTNIPSPIAKSEWMIFKSTLTVDEKEKLTEPWEGTAYRKNKLDLTKLGVTAKKGQESTKIDSKKIITTVKTSLDLARYEYKRKIYLAKRPFIKLYRQWDDYWVKPAWALTEAACGSATALREVVCTVNKTGEDYATIALWEDAVNGDLVTDTQIQRLDCYNDDGDLSEKSIIINGSTTNATYFMKISVPEAERHDGTSGSGFANTWSGTTTTFGIQITDQYTVVEWMEVDWSAASGSSQELLTFGVGNDTANFSRISNCIVHGATGIGIWHQNDQENIGVYNNIIYSNSTAGILIAVIDEGSRKLYNNTIYGNGKGIDNDDTTTQPDAQNNIVYNNTTADFEGGQGSSNYNFSKDDTASGANSINGDTDGKTPDFVDVGSGTEDFHITSTSDAIDVGVDLGAGVWAIDIDGRDRDSEGDIWDIGADEFVSAPSGPDNSILYGSSTMHNATLN
jgi:hypothetical protein